MHKLIITSFLAFIFTIQATVVLGGPQTTSTDTVAKKQAPVLADSSVTFLANETAYLDYLDSITSPLFNPSTFTADSFQLPTQKELIAALDSLNTLSPIALNYNDKVQAFINLYTGRRGALTERVMGLSSYYFPLFEEELAHQNLPLELKYLPVVESALIPSAKSRARAVGLWQFIYSTGKLYGLTINSLIDERYDPILSTRAAVRFLGDLHKVYGDWLLALAAYNCGPGNVNKAIRRAGGKRSYWEIYPFLPRETRGYVPAFIAVNYVLTHAEKYQLQAQMPDVTYFEVDTVTVKEPVLLDSLAATLGIDSELLSYLNPRYKTGFVPAQAPHNFIYIPVSKVQAFIDSEEQLYALNQKQNLEQQAKAALTEEQQVHYVRSGEYLGAIASKYGVSVKAIQEWNNLRGTNIRAGQKLIIYSRTAYKPAPKPATTTTTANYNGEYDYYTIQSGDTLWDISQKLGVSLSELKSLNLDKNVSRLKPGDKIRISKKS